MPENPESEQNRIDRLKPLVNNVASKLHNDGINLANMPKDEADAMILNAINTAPEEHRVSVKSLDDEKTAITMIKRKLAQLSLTGSDFY